MNLKLESIMKIKRALSSKIFSTEEGFIFEHSVSELAKFFQVSRQAVYNIKFKKTYEDVEAFAQKIRRVVKFPKGSFYGYRINIRDDSEYNLRE